MRFLPTDEWHHKRVQTSNYANDRENGRYPVSVNNETSRENRDRYSDEGYADETEVYKDLLLFAGHRQNSDRFGISFVE